MHAVRLQRIPSRAYACMCMGMLHAHHPPLTRGQVRCCSDNKPPENWLQNSRWLKVTGCSVWAGSKAPGKRGWACTEKKQNHKTFAEAEAICKAAGARLCTAAELLDGCTKGTGCGLDVQLIWGVRTPSPPPAPPVG